MERKQITISKDRIQNAKENLECSKSLIKNNFYNFSVNRSYYAIFHAIRAVNALDDFDSSKHSGVISYFNEHYMKEEIFNKKYAKVIKDASKIREKSDYEDFYDSTKEEAEKICENAVEFVNEINNYLEEKYK